MSASLEEHFGWRRPVALPPLADFDTPHNRKVPPRNGLGEWVFVTVQASRMAGSAMQPSFPEFCRWMEATHPDPARSAYICELFKSMHPVELRLFMANCGISLLGTVKALKQCEDSLGCWLAAHIARYARGWERPRSVGDPRLHVVDDYYLPLLTAAELQELESRTP